MRADAVPEGTYPAPRIAAPTAIELMQVAAATPEHEQDVA
jgi:hypothetical protein